MKTFIIGIFFTSWVFAADVSSLLDQIPVQSGGRIKPFQTFAQESLQLIYGKSHYNNQPAAQVVFTWLLIPSHWLDEEIIEVSHFQLKENLKLDSQKKYFSHKTLIKSPRLSLILQELKNQKESGNKLDLYFQAIERLEGQIQTFEAIISGIGLRLLPQKNTKTWLALAELNEDWQSQFQNIVKGFLQSINQQDILPLQEQKALMDSMDVSANHHPLQVAIEEWIQSARAENALNYPHPAQIAMELHYNWLKPFRWAWIFYLLGALFFLVTLLSGVKWSQWGGFLSVALAFLLHTYGFVLRIYLTGRPPVSNMYESVVWVAWGAVFFAFFFEWWQRKNGLYIFSACVVALLCLITADMAPLVLDPTLQPLVPVLRSHFWLIVHVMTITLGYSAFFLSFILSNIGLGYFLQNPIKNSSQQKASILSLTHASYYVMQVGVVLLAAGTILGGIWADYSWGRFWGWDPKETWALIALLGYVTVLHGRLAGWLGHFGFLAWGSICFSLVLMAWYGVNFVLGAGLHSYGFGGGGLEYVSGFVALHLIYVSTVTATYRSHIHSHS